MRVKHSRKDAAPCPSHFWRHMCDGTEVSSCDPICSTCGANGSFEGWNLTMYEAMGHYQCIYELLPVGPHRGMADRLFEDNRRKCHACAGTGLISLRFRAWRPAMGDMSTR